MAVGRPPYLLKLSPAPCLFVLVTTAFGCGASPTTPDPGGGSSLMVSAVSPATLSTTGGASVIVTGSGFGAGVTVSIDGVAAPPTTVTATAVTFVAPVHAAGPGTLVVAVDGKTAGSAVTFVPPSGNNLAPTISNLRTVGSRANQPSLFADLGEAVQLLATVANVETDAALSYAWTVDAGSVTGTGPSVTWKLPAFLPATPVPVAATLTVTETYVENGVQHRNVAEASALANAHDSQAEIFAKGFTFLDKFSQSQYSTDEVLADFAASCYGGNGRAHEAHDVDGNRQTFLELPGYVVTPVPPAEFKFAGQCVLSAFESARVYGADACSTFDVKWNVRYLHDTPDDDFGTIPAGSLETSIGQDFVTAAVEAGVWKLCTSDYSGTRTVTFPSGIKKFGRVVR